MEKRIRNKKVIVPEKRKKIHVSGNECVQLELQIGNDNLIDKIIVSKYKINI